MELESCFKHLKTNGFNLEDMHFRDNRKIELMMALVTMAYCLSIGVASKKIAQKAIPTKKYANGYILLNRSSEKGLKFRDTSLIFGNFLNC